MKTEKGTMRQFFAMLKKARLPYGWILGYIAVYFGLSGIGIETTEYTAQMFAGNVSFAGIVLPFLFYTLISLAISSLSSVLGSLCQAKIDRSLRRMIWRQIVHLPLLYYERNEPRELLSRVTTDITTISTLIMQVFVSFITSFGTLFLIFQRIHAYDGALMWLLLAMVPIQLVLALIAGRLQFGVNDEVNERNARLTQHIAQTGEQAMSVKAFQQEDKEEQNGSRLMRRLYRSRMKNEWIVQLISPIYTLINMMQFILIVMVGRSFYAQGAISLAQWVAYFAFSTQIVNEIAGFCGYWTSLKTSQGATRRVAALMQEKEEALVQGKEVTALSGDIVIEDVSFSYDEKALFTQLSLRIPQHSITAIVGESGSGKTTLLNLIARLYEPSQGCIRIHGKDIASFSKRSYRQAISCITQESVLFSGTLRENLLYGVRRTVTMEELEEVIAKVHLDTWVASLAEGLAHEVGEGGSRLSGGQKQKLAIARAMLQQRPYLFMDEALAAVDAIGKEEIWEALCRLMQGKTTVYVAHDRQTIAKAEHIIVLEKGCVVDQGSLGGLRERNAYVRSLFAGKEERS